MTIKLAGILNGDTGLSIRNKLGAVATSGLIGHFNEHEMKLLVQAGELGGQGGLGMKQTTFSSLQTGTGTTLYLPGGVQWGPPVYYTTGSQSIWQIGGAAALSQILDPGGDYNATTGIFTAPSDGMYLFCISGLSPSDGMNFHSSSVTTLFGFTLATPALMPGAGIYMKINDAYHLVSPLIQDGTASIPDYNKQQMSAQATTLAIRLDAGDTAQLGGWIGQCSTYKTTVTPTASSLQAFFGYAAAKCFSGPSRMEIWRLEEPTDIV